MHPVWNGLQAIADGRIGEESKTGYVFIHDGARPFVTENILRRGYDTVCKCRACVAGMPSKDTIKIVDDKDIFDSNTGNVNMSGQSRHHRYLKRN